MESWGKRVKIQGYHGHKTKSCFNKSRTQGPTPKRGEKLSLETLREELGCCSELQSSFDLALVLVT